MFGRRQHGEQTGKEAVTSRLMEIGEVARNIKFRLSAAHSRACAAWIVLYTFWLDRSGLASRLMDRWRSFIWPTFPEEFVTLFGLDPSCSSVIFAGDIVLRCLLARLLMNWAIAARILIFQQDRRKPWYLDEWMWYHYESWYIYISCDLAVIWLRSVLRAVVELSYNKALLVHDNFPWLWRMTINHQTEWAHR